MRSIEKQLEKINSQIEDLNVKVLDFDMFENVKPSGDGGTVLFIKNRSWGWRH